jgi:hypothetical protein
VAALGCRCESFGRADRIIAAREPQRAIVVHCERRNRVTPSRLRVAATRRYIARRDAVREDPAGRGSGRGRGRGNSSDRCRGVCVIMDRTRLV